MTIRQTRKALERHPCFNPAVKGSCGRVHLPVAPKCNIRCNYCDRKYDCVNESRPGVTSSVLTPEQALLYLEKVLEKEPRITVAGIAGPGDPFANPDATMETLQGIRQRFPGMILCLATNGMGVGPYIDELAALDVSHVTVTVNAVDPKIGGKVYGWVRDGNIAYRGLPAAELLLARQLEAVKRLKAHGITVKINTIVIPTVNDHHVEEVAAVMKDLGVDLLNCMALFPNAGTPFADIPQPDKGFMARIRNQAERYLPQMRHCTRCRADAVGLLGEDRSEEMSGCLSACAKLPARPGENRPYVAVASREGVLVNQHLGEAERFLIFAARDGEYVQVEERPAPPVGGGVRRWLALAKVLGDCRAVLVSGVGDTPKEILGKAGLTTLQMSGFIADALAAVFAGKDLASLKGRRTSCAKGGCPGTGSGCV